MRIGFLNSIESQTYGGMEEWIRLVSDGLVKRGHEVTLVGRKNSEYLRRSASVNKAIRAVPLNIGGDFNPATIMKIKKLIRTNKLDLLSVNFNKDIRLGGLAARMLGEIPVIWSVGINITKDKMIHRNLTPKLIDGIIVPSHSLKGELVTSGYLDEKIIRVIPIGINLPQSVADKKIAAENLREKYNLPKNATVAVTVGRYVYKKAHEFLIGAIPDLIKKHPELYFIFVGDGPKRDTYQSQAKKLGVVDRIVMTGQLDDITLELAGADLMIHPSKEEPFGIVLLEGMSYGLPIAASRVGGIPEVVLEGETALLFEPENSRSLFTIVDRLLSDQKMMKRFSENGPVRVRDGFHYDLMIDRVETYLLGACKANFRAGV